MITIESSGSFKNTDAFLSKMAKGDLYAALDRYGHEGMVALANATPLDSGRTAGAWRYKVSRSSASTVITWYNTHVVDGVPIAIILQYGHGTGTGGYVRGRDYINPAIRPLFDKIANDVWKVVTSA